MPHMSHINDAYHLLLTSLIWRSNAGCCLWFRNWTNETLKTRLVYHINYYQVWLSVFLPLHLWVELGRGHTVTHRGSFNLTATFWTFSASAHFLNCFEFFLTQNYFSDFIFIESKKWTNQSDPIIFNWQVAGRLRERIWLWVKTVDHWAGVRGTARSRFDQKIERPSYKSLYGRVYRNNLDLIIVVFYKLQPIIYRVWWLWQWIFY